jgi:hypothetical protein
LLQLVQENSPLKQETVNPVYHDVMIGFLYVFSLKNTSESLKIRKKPLSEEDVIYTLKNKGIMKADWNEELQKQFEESDKMFLKENKPFRLSLESFKIEWSENSSTLFQFQRFTEVKPILTIHSELDIATLTFHIRLNDCSTDDIIFLKGAFLHGTKARMRILAQPSFVGSVGEEYINISENVLEKYISTIRKAFTKNPMKQDPFKTSMIEIRRISDGEGNNFEMDFRHDFPNHIYGILTNDEGFRYVPVELAQKRTRNHWHSRDFFDIISFDKTLLMLNFTYGNHFHEYIEFQKERVRLFDMEENKYLTEDPPTIAGVQHGPTYVLENVAIMRFLLDIALPDLDVYEGSNLHFYTKRDKLNQLLANLNAIGIREVKHLQKIVNDSMEISTDKEEIRKELDILERTLTMRYTKRMNWLLILFAFVPVLLTKDFIQYVRANVQMSLLEEMLVWIRLGTSSLLVAAFLFWIFPRRSSSIKTFFSRLWGNIKDLCSYFRRPTKLLGKGTFLINGMVALLFLLIVSTLMSLLI